MPLVDCLIMGALLSAVDPGGVLTVLPPSVDRQVSALLFGESVLNSAVAVVLFNSLRMYHHVLVERGSMDQIEAHDLSELALRFVAIAGLSMLRARDRAGRRAGAQARERPAAQPRARAGPAGPERLPELALSPVVSLFK
jgi:hypothetical protein